MQIKTAYLSRIHYVTVKLLHLLSWASLSTILVFSFNPTVSAEEANPIAAKGLQELWEVKEEAGRNVRKKILQKAYLQDNGKNILINDIDNYINKTNEVCRRYAPESKDYRYDEEYYFNMKYFIPTLRKHETKGPTTSLKVSIDEWVDRVFLNTIYTRCANKIANPNNNNTINIKDVKNNEQYTFPEMTPRIDGLVDSTDCNRDITALQEAVFTNGRYYNEALEIFQDVLIRTIQTGVKQTRTVNISGRFSFESLDDIYQRMIDAQLDLQSAVKRYNTEYHKQQCKDKDSGPVIEVKKRSKPLSFNDDNQLKPYISFKMGSTDYKGAKKGINKAKDETVAGGVPSDIIISSAEESSNHLGIEIGFHKKLNNLARLGFNLTYTDIGNFHGSLYYPNQSGGLNKVEGKESLISYGIGFDYGRKFTIRNGLLRSKGVISGLRTTFKPLHYP